MIRSQNDFNMCMIRSQNDLAIRSPVRHPVKRHGVLQVRTSSKQLWYAWYALLVMKITETHAQEHFENGSYIPQLFTRSSHLENPKCLNAVAAGYRMAFFCFR